ncbi:MAG: outer membrane lipid asymmetry maintenance protein MlaD [Pseudomonadota bacterium]|nr:outer membrane lipid asymmetry maintenance protein MlaD [Pseudomonadota bacterium]
MKRINLELAVGLFLLVGIGCVAWIAVQLGDVGLLPDRTYPLTARFVSISGLKDGATVELAGVRIGRVSRIDLDGEDYEAVVEITIDEGVRLQEDTIASIRTQGIIGDRFIKLSPGGSDDYLQPGEEIADTESAILLEELISKYIFESDSSK